VFVRALSGTIKIDVYTVSQDGALKIIDFPLLSITSTELLLKQASATLSNLRVVIQYTGDCDFDFVIKGTSGGTTSNTVVLGAANATSYKVTATTAAAALIPTALSDRRGLIIKNWTVGSTLYVGYSIAEANSATGWPMTYSETLSIDLEAGQTIYGVAASGTIDVRVQEAGG
jgi:hypothetical protein